MEELVFEDLSVCLISGIRIVCSIKEEAMENYISTFNITNSYTLKKQASRLLKHGSVTITRRQNVQKASRLLICRWSICRKAHITEWSEQVTGMLNGARRIFWETAYYLNNWRSHIVISIWEAYLWWSRWLSDHYQHQEICLLSEDFD